MIAFIKEHREVRGVEPICRVLQIAPSTFYSHLAVENDPDKASDRALRSGEQTVPRNDAQPALGIGFYLFLDLAGMCLCSIRHRYVRQQDRWLASL